MLEMCGRRIGSIPLICISKVRSLTLDGCYLNPEILVRADQLDIIKSTFGFENKAVNPPYRLFWTDAEFHLNNFTNHLTEGTAVGKLTGKFMDWGATSIGATFRPENNGPDFDLAPSASIRRRCA
jgi:hypothetical protein